jgi:predicted Zn finger-like uncharacterized protein
MIVTCPNCSTRFVVKAEALGAKGRKVRCAKCEHAWFQEPDQEALASLAAISPPPIAEPKSVTPLPEGGNVPVVTNHKAPLLYKIAFAAVLLVFFIGVSVINANDVLPKMGGYYGMFGLYDSKNFALADVKIEKSENGASKDLLIGGKIVNQSAEKRVIPSLRLTIYGKDKKKLKEITLGSEGAMLEGGKSVDFQNKIPMISPDSETVVMDLGNYLDLASR